MLRIQVENQKGMKKKTTCAAIFPFRSKTGTQALRDFLSLSFTSETVYEIGYHDQKEYKHNTDVELKRGKRGVGLNVRGVKK